ncbi:DNA repair protein RecO [Patescibacteria group bacterium]
MNPSYKTKGIIIRRMNVGEADRLLDIYTPQLGKIRVKARGVRKTQSKLSGHLEIFSEVDLVIAKSAKRPASKSDGVITAAQTINNHDELRLDLQKTAIAYYFCELIFWLTQAGHKDTGLYELLAWGLQELAPVKLFIANVEMLFLARLGYKPELYKDAETGEKLAETGSFAFSVEAGGVVNGSARNAISISPDTIKILRLLTEQKIQPKRWQNISGNLSNQTEKIARQFVHYTLEKKLKTEAFLVLSEKIAKL